MAQRIFGTIETLPSGRYRAKYAGPDGKRHSAPTTFIRKSDASGWLATQEAAIIAGKWKPPSALKAVGRLTLADYAEKWLQQRDLRPKTRYDYAKLLDRQILPGLGGAPLAGLTADNVRDWYASLDRATPTLRAHAYSLLRTILATAVAERKIDFNPCVIPGAGTARRARAVRLAAPEEVDTLVEAIPEKYRALVLLGEWCGLRSGELRELRRKDIVLKKGRAVVRVERQVSYTPDDGYVVGPPKTGAGVRDVSVPPHVIPAIRHHLDKFVALDSDALLFPADHGGHLATSTVWRHYNKGRTAAGREDLRLHDLRHDAAVLAAREGATLAELMGRLGHSTPSAAMRYQHVAQGRDQLIAEALSRRAEGKPTL